MTPERWQQVRCALDEAMALAGEPRAACLERIGASDAALRAEVESLLAADEGAGSDFLNTPAPAAIGFPAPHGRFVGRRLGPYQVLAEIGSGGMGEVYRAARVDEEYQQQVAIKLVRAGQESSFIANRLRAERQILASFAHPNIARLLDGGTTEEGIPYLVMELIDGQPITEYCDGQRLDTSARLRLFTHVCAAVQYAHQRMVIHRDLKPSNILVTADGVPKLLDFGIAKILQPSAIAVAPDLTVNAFGILTPQYASPEQVTGDAITAVSDVYSLGVILYELLTGMRPYSIGGDRNTRDIARSVLIREPKKPSSMVWPLARRPGGDGSGDEAGRDRPLLAQISAPREGSPEKLSRRLRGDLDNIVLMALRKEPERRYATVDQFAEDIRRHLQHVPVIARKDTLRYRASTFVRRHLVGVGAAGLVLAVLIIGIVATTREARIAETQRTRAEHRFSDVRKLAASLIFDIHDSIRDLPGAARSRHLLIDTSLHYLDSLSQEAAGDVGLQRELAAAYVRLGDLQGRVLEANEGDYAGAQKSYRRSLALLQAALQQDPGNRDARRDIVVTCGKLSDLLWNSGDLQGALEFSRLTVTHSAALAAAHAREAKYQGLLATAQLDYGYKVFQIKSDPGGALHYMQPAVDTLEKLSAADPHNTWTARTLALGYARIVDVLGYGEQRFQDALGIQQKQRRVLASLVAAAPDNTDFAHLSAFAQHNAAETLIHLGRLEEASRYGQTALTAFRSLSSADPKVEEYHIDIGMALNDLARIALDRAEAEKAAATLHEALQQTSSVEAGDGADFRKVRADTQSLLGDALTALAADARRDAIRRRRDREGGCEQYRAALGTYRAISGMMGVAGHEGAPLAAKAGQCDKTQAHEWSPVRDMRVRNR
jgi:eukaryotic-like serine/threonine-protein kinase